MKTSASKLWIPYFASGIGLASGAYIAHSRKSGAWGYIGWTLLTGIGTSIISSMLVVPSVVTVAKTQVASKLTQPQADMIANNIKIMEQQSFPAAQTPAVMAARDAAKKQIQVLKDSLASAGYKYMNGKATLA